MPQVMQHLQVVALTIPVWYNGAAWTKLGGGSGGTVDLSMPQNIH
jgi:hypothetical protein